MTYWSGKVVAVTGAASGIGRALAHRLYQQGASVALCDVNEPGMQETAQLLSSTDGSKVTTHRVDVSDRQAVERWAAEVELEHGGVDGIVNNAGLTVRGTIASMPYEDFKRVLDVDMWGVIHGVRAFLPYLRIRGGGHIVNISSINGMVPFAHNGPYNMAKYAVLGLSETLMQELAREPIHVSCVHPGGVRTNIVRNAVGMAASDALHFDRIARTSATAAAQVILDGAEKKRRYIYVGLDAKLMATAKRLLPEATVRLVGAASSRRSPITQKASPSESNPASDGQPDVTDRSAG